MKILYPQARAIGRRSRVSSRPNVSNRVYALCSMLHVCERSEHYGEQSEPSGVSPLPMLHALCPMLHACER